jgi:hypothetical protein
MQESEVLKIIPKFLLDYDPFPYLSPPFYDLITDTSATICHTRQYCMHPALNHANRLPMQLLLDRKGTIDAKSNS